MGWGKSSASLEFGQCQLSLWLLKKGGEFPISLKEELRRFRILRFLYSNGLRNQRVNSFRNQSIGQYLSVHKNSLSNPSTNRSLQEAVVGDWPKMMKFKAL
ncbi:hypothetical protein AVEN_10505-1 [Araneus ventricosus]|uniref:Uncharacterized protein n=1 Tax=Araneus ventricosus TaxID=182803 RepID=A0A4Y2JGT5_ARAVE|nr:hypothetical protein AVEN_10505-1 [Araneus ventricosus]